MVLSGFYNIYGVRCTTDEMKKIKALLFEEWDDDEICYQSQINKEKYHFLVQMPHGYEDLEEGEWFYGVGKLVYFTGRGVGDMQEFKELFDAHLNNLVTPIKFTEQPRVWMIPNDCPCCS